MRKKPLGELAWLKRIKRRHRVPVVLSREAVKAVLEQMTGVPRLMAEPMFRAGLRVYEWVLLPVKGIDFSPVLSKSRMAKGQGLHDPPATAFASAAEPKLAAGG